MSFYHWHPSKTARKEFAEKMDEADAFCIEQGGKNNETDKTAPRNGGGDGKIFRELQSDSRLREGKQAAIFFEGTQFRREEGRRLTRWGAHGSRFQAKTDNNASQCANIALRASYAFAGMVSKRHASLVDSLKNVKTAYGKV